MSPFMEMAYDYRFRVGLPGERLFVTIDMRRADQPEGGQKDFNASLALRRVPITGRALALTLARFPLMTVRVLLAIHAQALRLWLKRVPVRPHPAPPPVGVGPPPTRVARSAIGTGRASHDPGGAEPHPHEETTP